MPPRSPLPEEAPDHLHVDDAQQVRFWELFNRWKEAWETVNIQRDIEVSPDITRACEAAQKKYQEAVKRATHKKA
jgi:hypothetical protein